MEGYNNYYSKLYVLRMNENGNDVEIEEHEFARFPEMGAWFNDANRYRDIDKAVFKEIKLVEQCVRADRIVKYSTSKSELERVQKEMRQSLSDYAKSVSKVEQAFGSLEVKDIRHDKSMEKLDLCSFSDTFYIYGKPFLKLEYRLGHLFRTDSIMTGFDIPRWKIEFLHLGSLSIYKGKELLSEEKTFDEWLRLIVQEPEDVVSKKEKIRKMVHDVFCIDIQVADILYDLVSECFVLKDAVERLMLKDIMPQKAVGPDKIAKYTTLDTLVSILQSGKIRMNSIVSMNDKTETDFLEEYIRNYKEEYEEEDGLDKYLFADKEFITSFTTRVDDLDMWRLYGDNAHGVCMVFDRVNKEDDGLYEIRYVGVESNTLKKIMKLQDALKAKNIRFRLNLLKKFQHFIKHVDYSSEKECRLLVNSEHVSGWFVNRDNGILTPFVERSLRNDNKPGDENYPFRLSEIIVGPSSKEKLINMMQIFYMVAQNKYWLSVSVSKIVSYR